MAKRSYQRRNSGLLIADDSIALPSREDARPWYARKLWPDSRRWMSRRRCCCTSCIIFSDDFAADDLAANWTQQSGTWSIGSGVLSTSSSNAVLTCNTAYPGSGFHGYVIEVALKASTYNNSRIVFGNGYVEVVWNGVSSVVNIKTSGGTLSAASSLQNYTNGSWHNFRVCVHSDHVTVSGIVSGAIESTTIAAGIGTGATSESLEFDLFSFEIHHDDNSECKDCTPGEVPCSACPDGLPQAIVVDIDGVVAHPGYSCYGEPGCDWYNQSHELVWGYESPSGYCRYLSIFGPQCVHDSLTSLAINATVYAGFIEVGLTGDGLGATLAKFHKAIPTTPDCFADILGSLTNFYNTATKYFCDASAATCTVSLPT